MCLLHEKPFAGINGSGKHVNWSVGNSTQGNLLDPGTTPHDNLNFLLFCGAVIRGVHLHGPLLRAVIASAAKTGSIGDGKIWVTKVESLTRIRTGELGEDAI